MTQEQRGQFQKALEHLTNAFWDMRGKSEYAAEVKQLDAIMSKIFAMMQKG